MKRRYLHADANLYSHIGTLRIIGLILAIGLLIALLGWHNATRVQRVSIPPELRFGGLTTINRIHPWEVYNFTGYIWQQLNRCKFDCSFDYQKNLDRLTAFLSPSFKAWLKHDSIERTTELKGRTRYLLPRQETDYRKAVINESENSWRVYLDVDLSESIGGVAVKQVQIRFAIRVVYRPADPESNPWGLVLEAFIRPPERIS